MMEDNPDGLRPVALPDAKRWTAVAGLAALLLTGLLSVPSRAYADAAATVDLHTAATYSVLGSTVASTGTTTLSGDLGATTSITGSPTVSGKTHAADAAAAQAQSDLTTAYDNAAGRTPTATVAADLGGQTLTAGVYRPTSSLTVRGTLTLDGRGDPNAVFIFQLATTLTTASGSHVTLAGGAQASHVFWQVGSTAWLGTGSTFSGTIMAQTSITLSAHATVHGRALARDGAVTLDTNTFTEVGDSGSPQLRPDPALAITVPAGPVNLASVTVGTDSRTISGQLGVVTVTDTRGGTTGWTATALATDFTGPQTIPVSATGSSSYLSPPASVTGTAKVAPSDLSPLNPQGPVQVATGVNGNNTASWNPTIFVTIPGGTLAGTYTTTITHSVL
jgi:hypothetical protein